MKRLLVILVLAVVVSCGTADPLSACFEEVDRSLDCSNRVFRSVDLSDRNLRNIDLRHANLWAAKLTEGVLVGANLSGANLERADLTQAWWFHTASGDNIRGSLLAMRDDAMERVPSELRMLKPRAGPARKPTVPSCSLRM